MNSIDKNPAWRLAIFWYGISMLPRLRKMTHAERAAVLREVGDHNLAEPLHLIHRPFFVIPSWSDRKLTGGQVTAPMIYGLWVHLGEDEGMASGLINDWPEIKDACAMATKEVGQ